MISEGTQQQTRRLVLVVDDEPLTRKLAGIRLTQAGFEVLLAGSGEEALQLALVNPPDAVLSDVRMTGMSGFELRSAMRSDRKLTHVPVILLSAEEPGGEFSSGDERFCLRTPDFREAIEALRRLFQVPDLS